MKARNLALLLGSFVVASPVFGDISYDYIEVGYGATAVDVPAPFDGDGRGPEVFASYQVFGPITAFAGASYRDFSNDNFELNNVEAGLGWNKALGKDASFFANVAYLYSEIDPANARSYDEDGYGVTLGYRAENQSPWEFIGTLDYVNVESGVEFGGGMALIYDATRRFGLTGGISYFDDTTHAFLGVRYFLDHRH